jgi:hypothetical protein
MRSRRRKLSLLDVANGDCKAGEVVVGITRKEPLAERAGARLVSIGESSSEGALKEIGISRVDPEDFLVEDLRCGCVPISARDKSRKIVSGLAIPYLELLRRSFALDRCGSEGAAR